MTAEGTAMANFKNDQSGDRAAVVMTPPDCLFYSSFRWREPFMAADNMPMLTT